MNRMHSAQYTVRNVSPDTDRRLRDMARRQHRSLNETLVDALSRIAGTAEGAVYHDLDGFFGSWVADAEVDHALAEQRKIDKELWK